MSKTLIIMRHAKSSWDFPYDDFDRSLNTRGYKAAAALGDWLRAQNLAPDEILCSAAKRAQETGVGLKLHSPLTQIKELYMSSPEILQNYVQQAHGDTVLIIAHNPGIGEFVERLATTAPNHERFFDYPSGATTVFDCDIDDWSDLNWHKSKVVQFVIPSELP